MAFLFNGTMPAFLKALIPYSGLYDFQACPTRAGKSLLVTYRLSDKKKVCADLSYVCLRGLKIPKSRGCSR